MADESEASLIRRSQSGDKEAFAVLVRRYAAGSIGSAYVLLRNHADALDVSQEAFVRAWRGIRRFAAEASFYTWYSTILRNLCVRRLRRRGAGWAGDLDDQTPASPDCDPGLLAERNERTARVWRAVLALPLIHREVVVMYHFQHMSYRQIAKALQVPLGTVMSRLHNARTALREKLAGERP